MLSGSDFFWLPFFSFTEDLPCPFSAELKDSSLSLAVEVKTNRKLRKLAWLQQPHQGE
jgi:hypothetical protein